MELLRANPASVLPGRPPRGPGFGRTVRGAIGAALLALSAGCAQTRQFQPAVDPNTLTETQFIHYLETVPLVSFEEGCRAMIIAADGQDRLGGHADRLAELERRGIVRREWKIEPDQVLDIGTLAYMIVHTAKLPPSVNSILFGSWGLGDRRYAMKQAAAAGIVNYAPPYHLVTGGELVAALARTDEYMVNHGLYGSAAEASAPAGPPG